MSVGDAAFGGIETSPASLEALGDVAGALTSDSMAEAPMLGSASPLGVQLLCFLSASAIAVFDLLLIFGELLGVMVGEAR